MKNELLYKDFARYYDLIYSFKDYKKEVEKLKKIIQKNKKSKGKKFLDVACGTGHHLKFLKRYYTCTGIDKNLGVLNIARKNVKGVSFRQGDMINFRINKKFDIITCLFSSIGYVRTYKNLRKTILNFYNHLANGGVLIVEPWFDISNFYSGKVWLQNYESDDIKISRVSTSFVKNNCSFTEMQYLIGETGKKIKHFSEIHEMGLFDIDKTLDIMKNIGFRAKFLKNGLAKGRGLFICVKE